MKVLTLLILSAMTALIVFWLMGVGFSRLEAMVGAGLYLMVCGVSSLTDIERKHG